MALNNSVSLTVIGLDYPFYIGEGFPLPEDKTEINQPAGSESIPLVMTEPRSAEAIIPPSPGTICIVKEI